MRRSRAGIPRPAFEENQFGKPEIPHGELKLPMVPSSRAEWHLIARFALTYDGYAHKGPGTAECARIANPARARYHADGTLPDRLDHLRTCLFFEQRRYHHYGESPAGPDLRYIRALVLAIRKKVAGRRGIRAAG